jgi:hypothetical protein
VLSHSSDGACQGREKADLLVPPRPLTRAATAAALPSPVVLVLRVSEHKGGWRRPSIPVLLAPLRGGGGERPRYEEQVRHGRERNFLELSCPQKWASEKSYSEPCNWIYSIIIRCDLVLCYPTVI